MPRLPRPRVLRQCVGGGKQKPRAESDRKRKEPQKGLTEARSELPPPPIQKARVKGVRGGRLTRREAKFELFY